MLFSNSYFTVSKPAEGIFKDRGSKFLSFIFPVFSEAEIKQSLQVLRKEHPSAKHHCYAWRLGADKMHTVQTMTESLTTAQESQFLHKFNHMI